MSNRFSTLPWIEAVGATDPVGAKAFSREAFRRSFLRGDRRSDGGGFALTRGARPCGRGCWIQPERELRPGKWKINASKC
jgi:hypothetical protein